MPLPKTVIIEGKRYPWREILKLRREQRHEQPVQSPLFEMRDDARPASQTTAAGRFQEPTLFKVD